MCGRYSLTADKKTVAKTFGVDESKLKGYASRFNIAPSQIVPVIVQMQEREFDLFRWGLIPSWARDPSVGNRMINARSETLQEKPSFRSSFKHQRCLVLADGFYEWKAEAARKVPYYIRLKSGLPFAFAGLWSEWEGPGRTKIRSCTIITGEPNDVLAPIHNRMPVILAHATFDLWLDSAQKNPAELAPLFRPYPSGEMEAFPVSKLVNSPQNDSADCIAPLRDVDPDHLIR